MVDKEQAGVGKRLEAGVFVDNEEIFLFFEAEISKCVVVGRANLGEEFNVGRFDVGRGFIIGRVEPKTRVVVEKFKL